MKQERPRRYVSPITLRLLTPLLRHSASRDAFVLRLVGNKVGPVLRPKLRERVVQQPVGKSVEGSDET
ncbi:MAG: hypothetical protein ACYDHH_12080 [Solirubrobacteraceae bacterium]